jgi:hypothetical protein
MRLPNNTNLPFFAYGIFKPRQLCFFRIRELVKNTRETKVKGVLKERDGIPLLVLNEYSRIKGVLIHFKNGKETEAYNRIVEIEPDEVYRWKEIAVNDGITANTLLGKREARGSSDLEHVEE